MLFLVKRDWRSALTVLGALLLLGGGLRGSLPEPPPLDFSPGNLGLGLAAFALILLSDLLVHSLLLGIFGERYRARYLELAAVFQGQRLPAMLAGALLAGLGEELVFRGLSADPWFLLGSALIFGGLHHIRQSLWPFTVWAGYQGLLLGVALAATGSLSVTMTAHFLHDLAGFLVFRQVNRRRYAGS